MKKTLKLALGALMMAGAVNAQVATLPNGYYDYEWGVLPKLFSSDGKGKLVATEYSGEGSNIKVNVYNSSFNVEHSFEIVPHITTSKTVTERRAYEAVPGEFVTLNTERIELSRQWNQASLESKIEWLKEEYHLNVLLSDIDRYVRWERNSIYTDTNGDVYIYLIGWDDRYEAEQTNGTFVLSGETLKFQSATSEGFVTIDMEYYGNIIPISWSQASQEEKIEWLRRNGRDFYVPDWDRDSIHTNTNGDVYMYLISTVYIDDYPELAIGAFVLNGATLKYQPIDYLRTGEWEVVEVDEYTGENYMSAIWNMMNIDDDWSYELGEPLIVTQTLFNADAKYEYLRDKRVSYSDRITYENDNDGDGIVDYRTISSGYDFAGYEVVSEDGNVIASFDVDDVDGKYLILWGGKRYLGFNVYGDNNGYSFLIYEINSNGSGITRASSEAFMHILPAMPRKNTTVTVELGEESAKNGGQLMITDMKGRTVYTTPVAPNETSVQVPLRRMASGVYSVTLMNRGQKIENSKLIIR